MAGTGNQPPQISYRVGGRGKGRGRGRRQSAGETRAALANAPSQQAIPPSPEAQKLDKADDSDVCFICANPVKFTSIAPCNHKSCHVCALRMRALYENKDCPHCRAAAPRVVFTRDGNSNFEDYTSDKIELEDKNIGILYGSADISSDTVILLRYNCPDDTCDFQGLGWPDLHRHVKTSHYKRMCDLCSRHKKVFTHEHALFNDRELEVHMSRGDDRPGAVDQTGFKGHPRCDFCRERYYDADKLYEHCRNKHERCFLCDRDNPATPHYYRNYDDLERHFGKNHFLCLDKECLDKKFVVFSTHMDLKAHQLEEHGSSLSKDVRRDTRTVDMRDFDYRQSYQPPSRRGGGGRGRNPDADGPLPASSAQPLRRDELAFQRQLAIQMTQPVAPRMFGGQLTQPTSTSTGGTPAGTAGPSAPSQQQPQRRQQAENRTLQDAMGDEVGPVDASTLTPHERARLVRHGALIERASNLLGNNASKLAKFRSYVSSYKRGSFTADQLLNAFFVLFTDSSSTAIGTLVNELADLYESQEKREGLLKSWSDWRAINEDYPSLPAAVGQEGSGASSGWAAVTVSLPSLTTPENTSTSNREVLKLKSATRKSPKHHNMASIVSTSGSEVRVPSRPRPPTSSSSAFPSLPPAKPPPPTARPGGGASSSSSKPSWTVASGSQVKENRVSKVKKMSVESEEAFPSLPAAPKPQTTVFGNVNRVVRRDFAKPTVTGFSWGAGGGGVGGGGEGGGIREEQSKGSGGRVSEAAARSAQQEQYQDEEQVVAGGGGGGGGGKGKKKAKKVLMQWG